MSELAKHGYLPNRAPASSEEEWMAVWGELGNVVTTALGASFYTIGTTAYDAGNLYIYAGERRNVRTHERIAILNVEHALVLYERLTGHPLAQ